jgi:hypothetical protein
MKRRNFLCSAIASLGSLIGLATGKRAAAASGKTRAKYAKLECPWCNTVNNHIELRRYQEATEYRCYQCAKTHTRKVGSNDAFAFFPEDIKAAFSSDVEPLAL